MVSRLSWGGGRLLLLLLLLADYVTAQPAAAAAACALLMCRYTRRLGRGVSTQYSALVLKPTSITRPGPLKVTGLTARAPSPPPRGAHGNLEVVGLPACPRSPLHLICAEQQQQQLLG